MPTKRRQKQLRESDAIRRALVFLGGEQTAATISGWIKVHAPALHNERRIVRLLQGHPNDQVLVLGPASLERTTQGYFKLTTRHNMAVQTAEI